MKNCNIHYYHPLNLTFKSAQTLQIIKDYFYLSKHGYNVYLYGYYNQEDAAKEIEEFIEGSTVFLKKYRKKSIGIFSKLKFISRFLIGKDRNIVIARHYRKLAILVRIKKIYPKFEIYYEMHEESFPFLLKKNISKHMIFTLFQYVDRFVFTNYSQLIVYKKEFGELPNNYIVLPNGFESKKFTFCCRKNNFVITYLGQFNKWKNIELIFAAMRYLDQRYVLRIAGGKGDETSNNYIKNLMEKYHLPQERVNYLGFVSNNEIAEKVLNHSNVLLLPLGNNIQSKYLTSPMKLFEYMATKIPVVAVDYPSIQCIVKNDEVFLSKNDPKDFAHKIALATKADENKIHQMNALSKKFSYNLRSKRYHEFIQE